LSAEDLFTSRLDPLPAPSPLFDDPRPFWPIAGQPSELRRLPMTRFSSVLSRAGRSLGGHLVRLRRSFDTLAEQVREAIARAIGRTVAEAVTEAIHAALAEPAFLPAPSRSSGRPPPLWEDPDDRPWSGERDDPYESGRYRDRYADDDRLADDEDLDDDVSDPQTPSTPPLSLVRRALAVGCRAAAWWLDRHPGRFSLAAAVGVGVIAGVAVLMTGSSLAGASGVTTSALALLALLDAVRSGTAMLAAAGTS
jgi:hypothetical protein